MLYYNSKKVPRVQFIVSLSFHEHFIFDHNLPNNKLKSFLRDKEKFSIFFGKYHVKTLKLIQKYLGGTWQEKYIEIYFCISPDSREFPSIAFPLLLQWRNNKYLAYYVLVHELTHRYIYYCKNFSDLRLNSFQAEVICTLISDKIFSNIFGNKILICVQGVLKKFVKTDSTDAIYKGIEKIRNECNLEKKPLLKYLRNHSI